VGTIASFGQVTLRFDSPEPDELKALAAAKTEISAFPDILNRVFTYERSVSIEKEILSLLTASGKKAFFAESCTGGLLSKLLTDIPGSSNAFLGSLVTYDNAIKTNCLRVSPDTLSRFGAVSSETAYEMLQGLETAARADYYLSVTGIAGPDGGSSQKPVGTVFIGLGRKDPKGKLSGAVYRFGFQGSRETIRQRIAMKVFEILWLDLRYGKIDSNSINSLLEKRELGSFCEINGCP
jgi:PncC family amidohydrolase